VGRHCPISRTLTVHDTLIARDRPQIVIDVQGELFARPRIASA
jgi:hypothetical protein